ncbi:MAG: helix-turn-helix transcriptional regulator [Magnetococcales bacterium]|nr:helix-turn-helix transcriptional regulator [Magnetococcales bacterium]
MIVDRHDPVPHDDAFVARMLANPEVKAAHDALEEEHAARSAFLEARKAAGLTQEVLARRMGTTKSAISRLESSLVGGRASPSLSTLRRYAQAVGCKLELKLSPR